MSLRNTTFLLAESAVADSDLIVSLHDHHGVIFWISAVPTGTTVAEAVGTRPWDWVPEAEKRRVKAFFATTIAVGDPQHFQSPAVVAGREIQLDVRIEPTGCEAAPIIALTRVLDYRVSLLTQRERQIALLTAEGLTAKKLARRAGISATTVDTHRARIRKKLGLRSTADLALFALLNLRD